LRSKVAKVMKISVNSWFKSFSPNV